MTDCVVYLGTHQPQWLARYAIPMFVSRRTLAGRKSLPKALGRWALDSGGFSELQLYGRWVTAPEQYVSEVRRFTAEIGRLDWAAIQDWMCEPQVINGLVRKWNPKKRRAPAIDYAAWKAWAREVASGHVGVAATLSEAERLEAEGHRVEVVFHGTGLSVEEHQRRTIASYRLLRTMASEVSWTPVIQGDFLTGTDSHMRHVGMYLEAGFDLRQNAVVGVGSVCRLRNTEAAERFFRTLHEAGIRGHGFGLKGAALERVAQYLASSDSLAWSFAARKRPTLPECIAAGEAHKNCANCARFALRWLDNLLARLPRFGRARGQLSLFPELTRSAA